MRVSDTENLFAINRNVWYNTYKIRRIKIGGGNYPFYYLLKNIGIAVGIIIFIASCFIADDFIFSFSFTGSGSVYEREIREYLENNGVRVYTRFSDVDLKRLEDALLSSNDNLSFVSCIKKGNRLVIDSALSGKKPTRLSGKETALVSDVTGVIRSIKVYRGTAVKCVGDTVENGEIVVCGYADVKDVRVDVNVVATVTVGYSQKYEFIFSEENDGAALAFAEESSGKVSFDGNLSKREENGKFLYCIELFFERVITVG